MMVYLMNQLIRFRRYITLLNFLKLHGFPICAYCQNPTLGSDMHKQCQKRSNEELDYYYKVELPEQEAHQRELDDASEVQFESDQQHLQDLLDSFCVVKGCFVQDISPYTMQCSKHDHEDSFTIHDAPTELFEDVDDIIDECPGGCGESERGCVCAELVSLAKYNATPLEDRCGPWTA